MVRRLTRAGELSTSRANQAFTLLRDLPLIRHTHLPFLDRIWELHNSMTAYDPTYVALAEGLSAVLLTCDGKLARAHGHLAHVRLLT